ncbi:MAG: polysaccharide deacetylase family protein [Candidatus Eremiobacteraeota bacterium]|nr:polysaccharide deacetylase family protein [Candidatus Eremiobacteraeota bacterium]MBC5804190.1 polysaccharide deacetylase family protein [Candidatus Eremiobacteraeota bacterium]MBC5822610.1 polysaccharide deacetylase family protein [Candidatus Eremiobacteraeota bacterium]
MKLSRSRLAAVGGVFLAAALIGFGLVHILVAPVVPPVVVRTANAHRLLSGGITAHIDRLLHERFPTSSTRPRLVALTFDDGPYPVETPLLLDELTQLHVPATFFLIGDDTKLFPALAQRIAGAGDEIANHTQTHPANFEALGAAAVRRELDRGAATLEQYVHDPAIRTMMRPPHGRFTLRTVEAAQRDGYHVILWSDDPGDWRAAATPSAIDAHVTRYATAPDIILLHSGKINTIQALPGMVARFRTAGFRFVTVGELLRTVPLSQILHPERLRV